MKVLVINGPNLNFLGIRNKDIYGHEDYKSLQEMIMTYGFKEQVETECYQSNHEGAIIDRLQKAYYDRVEGIVINPGAYTHYSYAIRDAISSIQIPTVEVHISNIHEREAFRHVSVTKDVCVHQIVGKGLDGYLEAISFLKDRLKA
ncbi:type II 3-dehydroquinate dehydratase [Petrocella sp. FN5]|uniref:type II 3-dehydroquinate dehydratase n=1 Tax=Petrocella sp. FN5 TaxID=3032002 RepID=UPI0023DA235C|nr:type II 3-dehydroquinate dehydratase [Petrocella sp. FN5]MDF1617020.1 type II 3-dehydroquinate dehydratase [Petrocella sp. FN5]